MSRKQFLLLVFISALWGSSFLFMKILVPIFGPLYLTSFRLLIAGAFLGVYVLVFKIKIHWKQNLLLFLVIGLLNSAIPFVLCSFAAKYLQSNLSVILNSTSPMFGMLFGYFILKDKLSANKIIGLLLGTFGVFIISSFSSEMSSTDLYVGVALCITATILYGFSGTLVKKYAQNVESIELSFGSLLSAGIIVLPFAYFIDAVPVVTPISIVYLVIIGLFCTSIPYIIYYNLLKQVGPVKALMVTYLMAVFGILWGYLFLKETIPLQNLGGLAFILLGIYLISLKRDLFTLFRKKTT